MSARPPALWLLRSFLPPERHEPVLGDLVEEFALRADSDGRRAAVRWYWSQLARSLPRLAWASTTDRLWLRTWAVAAAAFILASVIELAVLGGVERLWPSAMLEDIVHLLAWLIAIAAGGYVAGRLQPAAPFALVVVILAVAVALAIKFWEVTPIWLQLGFFLLGPAACLTGAGIARRRPDF